MVYFYRIVVKPKMVDNTGIYTGHFEYNGIFNATNGDQAYQNVQRIIQDKRNQLAKRNDVVESTGESKVLALNLLSSER
jgi:hypothetical protein